MSKQAGKPKQTEASVQWSAQWIWNGRDPSPRNVYLAARREFTSDPASLAAERRLHISADARYRLYLNGEWLGDGPVRSFHMHQAYDTYDLTGLLHPGKNVLAALVSHYGEGTFQYSPSGQAGLLVQLERRQGQDKNWTCELASDESWQVQRHQGFLRPTPRISCQMPFVEIFDARQLDEDWLRPGSKVRGFKPAQVVGPAGCEPWPMLTARTVPFLTRTPVLPTRLFRAGLCQPAPLSFGFNTRPYLLPGHLMQNSQALKGFAATRIFSEKAQSIQIFTLTGRYEMPVVNGQTYASGDSIPLKAGENLCLIPFAPGGHHEYDRVYPAFPEQPLTFKGVFNDQTAWTIFGPFDNWPELHPVVSKIGSAEELTPYREKAQPVRDEDILRNCSPWMETTVTRTLLGEARIDNPQALFSDSAEVAVIHPSPQGDVEIFLDFGREYVGQLELDLEAPAGTVIDFNGLEEIEDGQRIHYSYGNECGMRYITRAGRQQYTSYLRRGYRYLKVVLRQMSGPVRLRSLRTIFSTYPSLDRGAFDCSDPLLTRIWEVGRHTLRCCSEDTFTDCPTYEQTYWVGDGRNESLVNYAAYGDLPLTRRCAQLPAESLFRAPLTESQVPSAWDNIIPVWSFLWIQMAEEHWLFSGDREFLKGIYPAVRTVLANCRKKFTNKQGLFEIEAWNFFDWAGLDDTHKIVAHNQMFLADAYQRGARMAALLGKAKDETWFLAERKALIAAINRHLWDEKRGAYIDAIHDDGTPSEKVSQQINSLAVLYEVASGKRLEQIQHVPVAPPDGMTKVGSPFALFYILEALIKQGSHADVLRIVREQWGEMVRLGATTFWEMFPGFWGEWWTRSYCHAWSAAPVYFLSRYQLGAWWADPGYAKALIAPVPLDLTWAKGRVPTPNGEIALSWKKCAEAFELEVALPAGTAATVTLPVAAAEYPKAQASDFKLKKVKGQWTCELPAGAHATLSVRRA